MEVQQLEQIVGRSAAAGLCEQIVEQVVSKYLKAIGGLQGDNERSNRYNILLLFLFHLRMFPSILSDVWHRVALLVFDNVACLVRTQNCGRFLKVIDPWVFAR